MVYVKCSGGIDMTNEINWTKEINCPKCGQAVCITDFDKGVLLEALLEENMRLRGLVIELLLSEDEEFEE